MISPICSYTHASEESVIHDDIWLVSGLVNDEPKLWDENCCPFCLKSTSSSFLTRQRKSSQLLVLCKNCGWWGIVRRYVNGQDESYITHIRGEAHQYDVSSLDVPVALLRDYLKRRPVDMALVHPTKFESLIADCLKSEYAPCEVIHVGHSKDRGIDILLVNSDKEVFLIQVKRRADLSKREGVEVVRTLNGVLFREGVAQGMVVTSAVGFTRDAIRETQIKTKLEKPYRVELVAFQDIVAMLNLPSVTPYEPWMKFSEKKSEWDIDLD